MMMTIYDYREKEMGEIGIRRPSSFKYHNHCFFLTNQQQVYNCGKVI